MQKLEQTMIPLGSMDPTMGLYSPTDGARSAPLNAAFSAGMADVVAGRGRSPTLTRSSKTGSATVATRSALSTNRDWRPPRHTMHNSSQERFGLSRSVVVGGDQSSVVVAPPLAPSTTARRTGALGILGRLRRDWVLLAMMLPGVLYLLVFVYLPNLGNIIAFQQYLPFLGFNSPFVGFENFRQLFAAPAFWQAVRNTIVISVMQLVLYFPAPSCWRCC